ncbi:hypothetical protein QAD02_001416 [Eretmocerus hayati]|uniref:Uncharacterized protein n=1 Tax=Eretmocerus hayati TaxID=131215 RepID=A0ACC2NG91_9HYME|nr:hypothetical protein QAD02_001416 [Eretmocerus hayati]
MNYNQQNARGRTRRVLDPSVGLSTPPPNQQMPPNPYMYNQQVPVNDMPPNYGFNMPQQSNFSAPSYSTAPDFFTAPASSTPYAYNQQPPMQPYDMYNTPTSSRNDGFGNQFASTTQLLSQPIVTNMAMHYGNAIASSGKQQVARFLPIQALRYYFAVNTDYVMMKLILLFFPFTHKDWTVKYEEDVPLQPRYERNAPDMYIPTMGFLTYVVLAGLCLGVQDKFTPETLGMTSSSALAWGVIELIVHITTLYVLTLDTSLKYLDLIAYCGYKYVGINAALIMWMVLGRMGYYCMLVYYSFSLGFFLLRSLKLRVQPPGHVPYNALGNKRRLYFIMFVAVLQPILMWWLSFHLV